MVNWEAKPWGGIGADMAYGGKKHIGAINFIIYFPAYLLPCQEWSHIPHNLKILIKYRRSSPGAVLTFRTLSSTGGGSLRSPIRWSTWGGKKRRNYQWIAFCRTGIRILHGHSVIGLKNKVIGSHLFLFGLNVHPVQDCLHHHVTQGDRVDKLQSRKPGARGGF